MRVECRACAGITEQCKFKKSVARFAVPIFPSQKMLKYEQEITTSALTVFAALNTCRDAVSNTNHPNHVLATMTGSI